MYNHDVLLESFTGLIYTKESLLFLIFSSSNTKYHQDQCMFITYVLKLSIILLREECDQE